MSAAPYLLGRTCRTGLPSVIWAQPRSTWHLYTFFRLTLLTYISSLMSFTVTQYRVSLFHPLAGCSGPPLRRMSIIYLYLSPHAFLHPARGSNESGICMMAAMEAMEASYRLVRCPSCLTRTFSPTVIRPERAPSSKHYGTLWEYVSLLLIHLSACLFTSTRPRRYLSPGTQFYVHPWSIQRDACNFVFHDTFQPER